jgi:hypothetical protein
MKTMRTIRIKSPTKFTYLALCLLFSILVGFVVSTSVSYAATPSSTGVDDMIPADGKNAFYNKYGPSRYAFQTVTPDRKFWQVGAQAQDGINTMYDHMLSMVFTCGVQITKFFNTIATQAFDFKIMNSLIDGVDQIIQGLAGVKDGTMGTGLWGSMFGLFVSITLIYVLWQIVRLKFFESLQTILSFILALVIALAFLSQAGGVLKFINTSSDELAQTMYSGLASVGGLDPNAKQGVSQITDQVWNELVMTPYGMLQFNDALAFANNRDKVISVLETKSFSDARDKKLKEYVSTWPAVSEIRNDQQMIILFFNGIFGIVILGLLIFWAIATIFIRIKLLIHAAVMAVTLLAALLPGREAGLSVVRTQFVKLIGLALMTVFTQFFLVFSLVMGHMAFKLAYTKANAGWFLSMFLEALMIFVVFKYREEIGSVFSKAAGTIPMAPKAKSTVVDAIQRNVTRSLYDKGASMVGGLFNRKESDGVPSHINPAAISKAGTSVNDATAASMQLRYQREKDASEQLAGETGQPVQYTPFVQSVNDNLRTGKNAFRGMDKEWKDEKTRLKAILDDGGDMKASVLSQGIHDGMNDQQVAATLYANESAIRQASTYMVNRPKQAVNQIARAGSLNKNRKLENTVNDFVMVELFQRFKVEYKQAIDMSAATGDPVKHTDFVKNMDDRFRQSGLQTTHSINDTMGSRKKRGAITESFSSMSEFGQKKDSLLQANEAFRKASASGDSLPSVPTISTTGPINATTLLSQVPVIPAMGRTMQVEVPLSLTVKPTAEARVDLSKVKLPDNLNSQMNEARDKLKDQLNAGLQQGERLEINTEAKTAILVNLKNRVDEQTSGDLSGMKKELEIMQRANGNRLQQAAVNTFTNQVGEKMKDTAETTVRKKKNKGDSGK